jgi:hypothetical protein
MNPFSSGTDRLDEAAAELEDTAAGSATADGTGTRAGSGTRGRGAPADEEEEEEELDAAATGTVELAVGGGTDWANESSRRLAGFLALCLASTEEEEEEEADSVEAEDVKETIGKGAYLDPPLAERGTGDLGTGARRTKPRVEGAVLALGTKA